MKLILILIALFSFEFGISQTSNSTSLKENNALETETPKPVSGLNKFYKYIADNFRTPEYEDFKGGRIMVSFFVEIDGTLGDIEVINDIGFGTDKQIIKILKKSPKWIPAQKDGIPVRVQYSLPINIAGNRQ